MGDKKIEDGKQGHCRRSGQKEEKNLAQAQTVAAAWQLSLRRPEVWGEESWWERREGEVQATSPTTNDHLL